MGQTIACANQKGGVGKTTTVVNLGSYLALAGERVLVVDLDPQGNATSGLGLDRNAIERSVYDAVIDGTRLVDMTVPGPVEGMDVVPSAIALAGAEVELAPLEGREHRLARPLADIAAEYDYILIDCPPSLGLLTVNALTAADAVLIPLQCEYYALEGMSQLLATLDLIRDHLNPDLAIKGVVLTMYDARTKLQPTWPRRSGAISGSGSTRRSSRGMCGSPRRRAMAGRSRATHRIRPERPPTPPLPRR